MLCGINIPRRWCNPGSLGWTASNLPQIGVGLRLGQTRWLPVVISLWTGPRRSAHGPKALGPFLCGPQQSASSPLIYREASGGLLSLAGSQRSKLTDHRLSRRATGSWSRLQNILNHKFLLLGPHRSGLSYLEWKLIRALINTWIWSPASYSGAAPSSGAFQFRLSPAQRSV